MIINEENSIAMAHYWRVFWILDSIVPELINENRASEHCSTRGAEFPHFVATSLISWAQAISQPLNYQGTLQDGAPQ